MNGAGRDDPLAGFDGLYETHGARLKSIACNLLGNVHDAEDAVHDAFLKAYRAWGGFKGDAAPFTWLYRILVNACLDARRRNKRRPDDPRTGPVEDLRPVSRQDHPLRVALESALDQLLPRQRAVFVLTEVEGFTHREVADLLEIAEGTSKHDLFLAKRELRRLLAEAPALTAGKAMVP